MLQRFVPCRDYPKSQSRDHPSFSNKQRVFKALVQEEGDKREMKLACSGVCMFFSYSPDDNIAKVDNREKDHATETV